MSSSSAHQKHTERMLQKYGLDRPVGQGTFGTVIMAIDRETNERVAIKKVMQDPRFKNRELQIMKLVKHPNVVALKNYYYTTGETKPDEVFLNVVMEFVPETLHRCCRDFVKAREPMPMVLVKVFMFQLLRSVAYLQLPSVNVCHRDIKPHNLLVDSSKGILKICDFGSAKQLSPTEPNVAYICSRYYRAPELIFGNQHYTPAIDIWSIGCIFGEMLLGEPIFKGENSMNQLIEIIKVLGTPTKEQLEQINKNRQNEMRLPQIKQRPWDKVFKEHVPPEAHDLASRLLNYVPRERPTPFEALCHPFFDELHLPTTLLHNNRELPKELFLWSAEEVSTMNAQQRAKLVKAALPPPAAAPTDAAPTAPQ
jgi:glycogen synthase kinase 3 beta